MVLINKCENPCYKLNRREEKMPNPTLASIESLSIPLVQQVVLLADYRCTNCQHRVAQLMSKMKGETKSILLSVGQKKVTLTYEYAKQEASTFAFLMRFFLSSCTT